MYMHCFACLHADTARMWQAIMECGIWQGQTPDMQTELHNHNSHVMKEYQ